MKLIRQPNGWTCQPSAYAMCMDLELQQVLEVLGHDGGVIENYEATSLIWTVKCFHHAELMLAAYKFGYASIEIPARVRSHNRKEIPTYPNSVTALMSTFHRDTRFVLTIESKRFQEGSHCVAYSNGSLHYYDPLEDRPQPLAGINPIIMVAAIIKLGESDACRHLPHGPQTTRLPQDAVA